MVTLSANEVKVLNDMSYVRLPSLNLGTKLKAIVDRLAVTGTPVNAVEASKLLTLTGVVIDGETVTIGDDVYEFLADAAQTKTVATNIGVNITANTVKASVTLTMDVQPTSGDKVTIGEKVYTFVPLGTDTADGEVSIGDNLVGAQANLLGAINGIDNLNTPHPLVTAAPFAADAMVITALVGGTAGNAIVSTETFTAATNVFSAVHLENGADCTAANADGALIAAVTASDTQGVAASQGAGTSVLFTADVAGATGNDIALDETLANGSFADDAVALSGGVDGTVGYLEQFMIDDNYLYVCIDDNDVSGKNWRRISIGAAY